MAPNRMKPETLEEQRDRLLALSEAERAGFARVTEGQLIGQRGAPVDPDGPEQAILERHEALRMERSVNDLTDEDAVDWQTKAFAAADKAGGEERKARKAARRSSRKSAAKAEKAEANRAEGHGAPQA